MVELWTPDERAVLWSEPAEPSWKNYRRAGIITRRDQDLLERFGEAMRTGRSQRDASFDADGARIAEVLLSCLKAINIPDSLWYLLYTVDEVLREDESRAAHFHQVVRANGEEVEAAEAAGDGTAKQRWLECYKPLLRVVVGTDTATDRPSLQARWRALSALRVLLSTADADVPHVAGQQRQCISDALRSVARESRNLPDELAEAPPGDHRVQLLLRATGLQASLALFQSLLQLAHLRTHFLDSRGLELLASAPLLCPRAAALVDTPVDVQYRVIFALWMLSYDRSVAPRLAWESPLEAAITVHSASKPAKGCIRELVAILRHSEKTRVVRVGLLLLRNLCAPGLGLVQQLIDVGAVGVVETLAAKSWPDAGAQPSLRRTHPYLSAGCVRVVVNRCCADIRGDAAHVMEVLRKELVALSDWSLYRQDVLSRTLSWSNPCHTDESFWRHAPAQTRPSFVGGD